MGKRSNFPRRKNDLYSTWDPRAVMALLPHLGPNTTFYEPCAGDGVLADQLVAKGHICLGMSDIEPSSPLIPTLDAMTITGTSADFFITNPPWTRKLLHGLIVHLSVIAPTWLLFDTDWAHSKQAIPYMPMCRRIVSVGRMRWIKGSSHDAKDNCAWYLFAPESSGNRGYPAFFPRTQHTPSREVEL